MPSPPWRRAARPTWGRPPSRSPSPRSASGKRRAPGRAIPLDSDHVGAEPWQYMVIYEFESEAALHAFVHSDTLKAMTRDYNTRFAGAGERARFTYKQIFP